MKELLKKFKDNDEKTMHEHGFELTHYVIDKKLHYKEIEAKLGDEYKDYKKENRTFKAKLNELATEVGIESIKAGVFKGYEAKLKKLNSIIIQDRNGDLDLMQTMLGGSFGEVGITNNIGYKHKSSPVMAYLVDKAKELIESHVPGKKDLTFTMASKSGDLNITYQLVVDEYKPRSRKNNNKRK